MAGLQSNNNFHPWTMLISSLLHEPQAVASHIARQAEQEAERSQAVWSKLQLADRTTAVAMANAVQWHHEASLSTYLNHNQRGILLTTIHGGDYLLALLKLRRLLSRKRRILIVRRKAASEQEASVFAHFNDQNGNAAMPVEVVRHSERRPITLIRALRAGHIVVALADLPAAYGKVKGYRFLGQQMQLVAGPGELAVLGSADVLPFMCCRVGGQSVALPTAPIRHTDPDMINQKILDIASRHITHFPGQWQHWFHVPAMLAQTRHDLTGESPSGVTP
ncbi:MAG: hypothetical protein KDI36_07315 [Pseudomonadales bacterium]|nr:hypothetical protein [Pseudomonadales bacterium]